MYHFTDFPNPEALRPGLLKLCKDAGIVGTLILAREGINGTVAGPTEGIKRLHAHINALPGCAGFEHKESTATDQPFRKMKIKLKTEIVTMGQPDVNPTDGTGAYVDPADWNALIQAPDVAVIDTRNDYEIELGTFQGALDPGTKSFREFPAWWEKNKDRFHNKRVAMFCTGGIRCEKSTNYLKSQGVEDVFHLKGGILKYLENVPQDQSMWDGECYVFDSRVSVGHGLKPGDFEMCFACGRPVSSDDKTHPDFQQGVQCPKCVDEYSAKDRARFAERQRQVEAGEYK